jgi:hypothetical protein
LTLLTRMHRETVAGGGVIGEDQRRAVALEIVRDYLDFRISGFCASQLLAFAMTAAHVVVGQAIDWVHPSERAAAIDRLCDHAYALFSRRADLSLGAFAQLTFLGCLYGDAGVLLANYQREFLAPADPELDRLTRRAQITEEKVAHLGPIAFVVPALLAYPGQGTNYLARWVGDRTIDTVPILAASHPAVRQLIDRWRDAKDTGLNVIREYHDLVVTGSDADHDELVAAYSP